MAERIQELCRTRRSDPQSAESWKEAMQILADVKQEYGGEGLGLTFIYSLGMRACLDFGHPGEALRLFREVCGAFCMVGWLTGCTTAVLRFAPLLCTLLCGSTCTAVLHFLWLVEKSCEDEG